jgi:hypothetical protein
MTAAENRLRSGGSDPDAGEAKHDIRETFLQPPSYINASNLPGTDGSRLRSHRVLVGKENRFYDYYYF